MKALITDIQRIESYPLLAKNVKVMGAVFSVESGTLTPVIQLSLTKLSEF